MTPEQHKKLSQIQLTCIILSIALFPFGLVSWAYYNYKKNTTTHTKAP